MQIATLAGKTLDFDDNFSLELLDRTGTEMIRAAGRLRLLQLPGVGHDQVDLDAARRAGIPVALSLGGTSAAVRSESAPTVIRFSPSRSSFVTSNAKGVKPPSCSPINCPFR